MSRIGNRFLTIPAEVSLEISSDFRLVKISGPLGVLNYTFNGLIAIKQVEKQIQTTPLQPSRAAKMMHGTVNALIANAFVGLVKGFEKILLIEGLGYKFTLAKPNQLQLEIGYSHPLLLSVPNHLKVRVEKNKKLFISGFDKQAVGLFASNVRKLRRCEPYKGKGIYYHDEIVRRKVGKTASK